MNIRQAFAESLRITRKARGLTQEDFSTVSSRTYVSTLERGLKSPTLDKIQALAEQIDIHPLTLLTLSYVLAAKDRRVTPLLDRVRREVQEILTKGG